MRTALRGLLVLGVAHAGGEAAATAQALVRTEADALERLSDPLAPAYSRLLTARLALEQGLRDQAIADLRAALSGVETTLAMPTVIAVRRRLGQVLGDEGTALVTQADAELRALGAIDLEATTRLFA
jgi:hypothetical protein